MYTHKQTHACIHTYLHVSCSIYTSTFWFILWLSNVIAFLQSLPSERLQRWMRTTSLPRCESLSRRPSQADHQGPEVGPSLTSSAEPYKGLLRVPRPPLLLSFSALFSSAFLSSEADVFPLKRDRMTCDCLTLDCLNFDSLKVKDQTVLLYVWPLAFDCLRVELWSPHLSELWPLTIWHLTF